MDIIKYAKLALLSVFAAVFPHTVYALESDSEQPIYIESDSATYDEEDGTSVYEGDVQVTQGSIRLNSDRLVVYTIDSKTDKIVATGEPVRFKQTPRVGKEDIEAEALQAVYLNEPGLLTLTDKAVVWQGENTYSSDHIEYDSINAIVKAGQKSSSKKRVRVVLQPKKKSQKK